ncbi:hypothetical protein [Burkholderia lata]|uniref:hypothetical protein n=1 Tax=Burkholderia lata (strain ATCC 17760 / DSM 23089 / LMG 22485 / NCIMB 9086 / R18194 / 383) TaxID=482957 RepID=UPI0012EA0200|nr:hypothetical protein [Burkholderia lata]
MLMLVWEAGCNGADAGQIRVNGTVNGKSSPPVDACDRAWKRKRVRVRPAGPAKSRIGRVPPPGTMCGDTRRRHVD